MSCTAVAASGPAGALRRTKSSRQALRGRARLAVDDAKGRVKVRGRQLLVVERPARLRVEVQGLLDQTVAVLVVDGDRYELFRADDRSYRSGVLPPGLLLLWFVLVGALSAYTPVMIAHGKSLFPPHLVGRGITLLNMGTMGGVFVAQMISGFLIDLFPVKDGAYALDEAATLDALYPDHGGYVSQVVQVVGENLAAGYITRHAAQATRTDAAGSGVGQ